MKTILIVILICFFANGYGQNPFNKTYGGAMDDMTAGIMLLESNRYIISFTDEGFTNGPMALYVNGNGDSLNTYIDNSFFGWQKNYNKMADNIFFATGGYYVLSESKHDVLLQIIDTNSTILVKRFGGNDYDYGNDIELLPDSGFIIVGTTESYGAGANDVYIIRTDKHGDSLWTRTFGQSGDEIATGIESITDSVFYVCGTTTSFGAQWSDVFVMKLNDLGDTSFLNIYGNWGNDVANAMVKTHDNGYAIAGWELYNTSIDGEFLLLKIDSNANQLFLKTYGYQGMDEAFDIKECYDHGFIMVGYSEQPGRGEDVYIVRTDSIGDTLWTKTLGGAYNDRAYSVVQTPDSGFAIVGNTYSYGAGGSDAFFLKLKPNGETTVSIGLPIEHREESFRVFPNPATNFITIEVQSNITKATEIRIYNALGKLSLTEKLEKGLNTNRIDLSSLSQGIYIIELRDEYGIIGNRKLIIE